MAPTITWRFAGADSGELAAAAFTWGVAHPTGYPLWTLLGALAMRLPAGDPAWRTNLLSAVFGGGAAALTTLAAWDLSRRLSPAPPLRVRAVAAATAGLALAVSPALWSQSIITETRSLHALLLAALLWLLAEPGGPGRLGAAVFVAGLSLTNHSTAAILVVPALIVISLRARRLGTPPAAYALGCGLFLVPLLLYLLLPWRAAQHPLENWGDPQTAGRLVAVTTGAQYHYLLQWRDLGGAIGSLPAIVRLFVSQFAWWVLPLSLYGILRFWERDRALTAALLVATAGFALFTATYRAEGAEYYLLPAYEIEAVFLGVGLAAIAVDLAAWRPVAQLAPATRAGLFLLLALFTVLPRVALLYGSMDLRHDTSARDYARATLDRTAPDSSISTSSDQQTFALWYVQKVEGYRRDVRVIDSRLQSG